MKKRANIVEEYYDSNVIERIEIMIRYYPTFLGLIEGYEQNLGFIIKQERKMKINQSKGELGVRVQTSGISNPTAQIAMDNIIIMEAIKSGNIESIVAGLDEEIALLHEREIEVLSNMKEDYITLQSSFKYLQPDEADIFKRYLDCGKHVQDLVEETDRSSDSIRSLIKRSKKTIVNYTEDSLCRKYSA